MFEGVKERVQSWKRGERRIAPKGQRGRVYQGPYDPNPPSSPPLNVDAKAKLKVSAVVTRADGTVEDLGELS
ncbi:MAG: hypothetical protein OES46_21270 [Gammaproteobacteria bacterium]|nr:hypothetical protein [Gammaproteobacteria bacterium]